MNRASEVLSEGLSGANVRPVSTLYVGCAITGCDRIFYHEPEVVGFPTNHERAKRQKTRLHQ